MRIDGGCHCGFITYEAGLDPEQVGICHCTDCQTLSGSAFRTFALAPKEGFKLLAGTPKLYVKTAESRAKRVQACPECGTSILPRTQIRCRSALGWLANLQAVKQFAEQPPLPR